MASFNPDIENTTTSGGYLNYAGRAGSNTAALGALFEGIGQTAGNYLQARNQEIQTDLSRKAAQGIDSYAEGVVNSASTISPGAGLSGPVPSEIAAGALKTSRLREAYDQGKLSDLNFWSNAQSIAKGLKSQYPGYSDIIDQQVVGSARASPANRIREELQQQAQLDAGATNSEEKFRRSFLYEHGGESGINPDDVDVSNPQQWHKAVSIISNRQAERAQLQQKQAQLSFNNASIESTQKDAVSTLTNAVVQGTDQFMQQNFKTAFDKLDKQYGLTGPNPKPLPPEARAQIGILLAQAEGSIRTNVANFLSSKNPSGTTWNSIVTNQADRDSVTNAALARLDGYKHLVEGDQWDAVKIVTQSNDLAAQGIKSNILHSDDARAEIMKLHMIGAISPQLESEMYLTAAGGNPAKAMQNAKDQEAFILSLGTVTGTLPTWWQAVQDVRQKPDATPGTTKQIIQRSMDTNMKALTGDVPELRDNAAKSIYASDQSVQVLEQFGKGTAANSAFNQLTDPRITKALKGTPNFEAYKAWSYEQFTKIGSDAFKVLNSYSDFIQKQDRTIFYDPSKGFQFMPTNNPQTLGMTNQRSKGLAQDSINTIQQQLNFLNTFNSRIKEIATAAGENPDEVLKHLYLNKVNPALLEGSLSGDMIRKVVEPQSEAPAKKPVKQAPTSGVQKTSFEQPQASDGSPFQAETLRNPMFTVSDKRHPGEAPDIKNVNPELLHNFANVEAQFGQKIPIVSGYRSATHNAAVGGARHSQHISGNAIDLDVGKLSNEQRVHLIKLARANGINGIGVYPNSLHFDIGGKRAWGPDFHSSSIPAWAQAAF